MSGPDPAALTWSRVIGQRHIGLMVVLGFASGLPLVLTGATLQAWLTDAGISIQAIGFFTLAGWPYLLKPLWAPIIDRYVPPLLGRRRGWMLLAQMALVIAIGALAFQQPQERILLVGAFAVLIAVLSATQDIAADAFRADSLAPRERGFGAALWTGGYRIAMLVAGPFALIIADQAGFRIAYLAMAALMCAGIAGTLLAPDPAQALPPPRRLRTAVVEPFLEFLRRPAVPWLLLAIVLYKFGDAFTVSFQTTFLLRGLEFSLTEVGAISKTVGIATTIAGALFGGALMVQLGLYRSLFFFGILQAASNLGFALLALIGKSYAAMITVIAFEYFTSGMGTAAFLALLMALCDARYSATQFALLSALSAVGRVLVGPLAGYTIEAYDWLTFYLLAFFTAVPGLLVIRFLKPAVEAIDTA